MAEYRSHSILPIRTIHIKLPIHQLTIPREKAERIAITDNVCIRRRHQHLCTTDISTYLHRTRHILVLVCHIIVSSRLSKLLLVIRLQERRILIILFRIVIHTIVSRVVISQPLTTKKQLPHS